MANIDREIKPIVIFGYVLMVLSVVSVVFFYWVSLQVDMKQSDFYFIASVTAWHLITGLGVIMRTKWGYYLFKFFLYLLIISFPIGTFISYKTLKYMKKNNIKKYFFEKST